MDLDMFVAQLHLDRLNDLKGKDTIFNYHWNSRGSREATFVLPTKFVDDSGGQTDLGNLTFYYADQNPNGKSREARMVRLGKWKKYDVGWLWTVINGTRVWLAKISPEGAEMITRGFIDKGIAFLRR